MEDTYMLKPDQLYRGRIMVVDDNPVNLTIVDKILRKDGYHQVDLIEDPTQVADAYRKHNHDLILLDIHMPVMSGFDVMAQLSAEYPHDYLPILVLTADNDPHIRDLCLAGGAKDFIGKPFERMEVLFRAKNILEVRLLNKQVRQHNEILEQKVRERTQQLVEAQLKIIECLGKAAEFRDNETGMHVVRMSRASQMLAAKMGLPEDKCEMILHASPMHDIGKIAIADNVLLKPGKLEGDAWEHMKSHAEVGAEILEGYDTDLMNMAAEIARTHHEKYDGSGYPKGLKGEEIPLHTRIVSVCDVFDALTSERPYKQPWPVKDAIQHLKSQSGRHFDPRVVQHFVEIAEQVAELRQDYPDLTVLPSHDTIENSLGKPPELSKH